VLDVVSSGSGVSVCCSVGSGAAGAPELPDVGFSGGLPVGFSVGLSEGPGARRRRVGLGIGDRHGDRVSGLDAEIPSSLVEKVSLGCLRLLGPEGGAGTAVDRELGGGGALVSGGRREEGLVASADVHSGAGQELAALVVLGLEQDGGGLERIDDRERCVGAGGDDDVLVVEDVVDLTAFPVKLKCSGCLGP
jgi:hypothetical protein